MNFWEFFLRLLLRKPKQALAALYWQLTRRRVRALNRLRIASADMAFPYSLWIDRIETKLDMANQVGAATEKWSLQPHFSVILHSNGQYTAEMLHRSTQSVLQQRYSSWALLDDSARPLIDTIASATGEFIVPLRVGDQLSELALFRFAEALQQHRKAAVLYGDQDELDECGRRTKPWFKPRWNEEMFFAQDYLAAAVAIDATVARRAAQNAKTLSEFLLVATGRDERSIVHVPHILCHVAVQNNEPTDRLASVARHLQQKGATCVPGPFETVKVEWPLPDELPPVTIIVPTRDRLDLLHPCIEGVLERTRYGNFEILIVDNGSVETQTAEYLQEIGLNGRVRILSYPGPYNFSAINNFAVQQARGTHLCLLNNDTEVLEPDWLTEMMRYGVRPDVGAVGAKLLYEDGSIQHAGVVIGIGDAAGHAHRFLPAGERGYFCQPHMAQFVSAVTAACLVVEKSKFLAVGGLDETKLAVAFNDVDLCLKLEAAGWRNIYVPHAVLVHHESKSRGNDVSPQNIDRYRRELSVLQTRWGTKSYEDPLHNPNLDRHSETFIIRL